MKPAMAKGFRNAAVRRSVAVRPVVVLLLLLWLQVLALAALPRLHAHVHADAAGPSHHCAVTAVEQGKFVLLTGASAAAEPPQAIALEPACLASVAPRATAYRPDLGRAPPAVFPSVV